jgi:hypothetical protein
VCYDGQRREETRGECCTRGDGPEVREIPQDLLELWQERTAIIVDDGKLPHAEAARLAWASVPLPGEER